MTITAERAGRGPGLVAARDALRRWASASDRRPSTALRVVAALTAVNTYAVIVMGGIVRTTGSGLGCDAPGDNGWPLCRGRLLPPLEQTAIIEFTHRWLAATMSMLLIALVATAVLRYRHVGRLVAAVGAVTGLLVVQITLGQLTVQYKLPGWIVMVHLANAELLLGAVIFTFLLTLRRPASRAAALLPAGAAAWMTAAAVAVYGLVLSGAFVVAQGAGSACDGWPMCGNGFQLGAGQMAEYNVFHRWVAGAAGLLLVVAIVRVLRANPGDRRLRVAGIAAACVLVLQAAVGAIVVEARLPAWSRSLHEALASALWGTVILLALLVRPAVWALDDASAAAGGQRS